MPSVFGLIANHINIAYFPWYIGALTVLMVVMFEVYNKKAKAECVRHS
jgi:fucose permease